MRYIEINNERYPVVDFYRTVRDLHWDFRDTCNIIMEKTYDEVKTLFYDDVEWSVITIEPEERVIISEDGNEQLIEEEVEKITDMSMYSVLGDIIVHNNGLITIVMGQLTSEELLSILLGE